MKPGSIAVVGAADTTELGKVPHMSNIQLHADAALNAMADAGLKPRNIDGIACCREEPTEMAHYLGITPTWVDGTAGFTPFKFKDSQSDVLKVSAALNYEAHTAPYVFDAYVYDLDGLSGTARVAVQLVDAQARLA